MEGTIRDVLEIKGTSVECVPPQTTVADAVRQMHLQNIGGLLVRSGDSIDGIFTERDVLFRVVDGGLDPNATTVESVMTRDPVSVGPATTVAQAMREVTDRHIRHLPVLDGKQLVGLVTSGDLTRFVSTAQKERIRELGQEVEKEGFKFKATLVLVVVFLVLAAVGVMTS